MSFQAMAWAVKQRMSTNPKFVLLMLANYASSEKGDCFPSVDTLMEDTGLARSTIQKCLKDLVEKGYITAHERWDNGRQLSNSYRLVVGWGEGPSHGHRGPSDERGGPPHGPTGARHTGTNLSEEPINQPNKASPPKLDEKILEQEFLEFWEAYPKRPSNPRQHALTSYIKARKKGASKEIIMAGVLAYARTRAGKEPEYTAMAATWLNQKRWEDDYEPVKQVRRMGNFV